MFKLFESNLHYYSYLKFDLKEHRLLLQIYNEVSLRDLFRIAKLTGHNQFEPLSKTLIYSFNKFGLKSTYVPKHNIEDGLSSLSEEKLNNLKQDRKINGKN